MSFDYLSREDLSKIHEATLDILENTGIRSKSQRFLDKASTLGLTVKEKTIYFPRDKVNEAIRSAPSHFSTFGRDDKYEIKWGEGNAYNHTCVGTPFIKDLATNKKRAVHYPDLENFIRVADALPATDIVSCIFPQDIPEQAAVTVQTAAMVKNTTKPLRICIESDHETKYIIEVLAAAVGGLEKLQKKPIAYLEVSPISPLDYAIGPSNGLMDTVEAGLPLGIIPCPMMGATGPMTLIGTVTMHNAEMLAGVVIAQLMRPGHPVIMSPRVTFMDMSTAMGLWAAPEMGLAATASVQMARYYEIPNTATGFSCASKVTDEQAAFESMYNALLPALAGADVIGASGSLDNCLISCYRKLVVDDEISSLIQRAVKGETVNEDTLAVSAIDDVVHGDRNFLGHPHTLKHLRTELWKPTLSNRSTYEAWLADGETTFSDRAKALAEDLLANHTVEALPAPTIAAIEAIVAKAIKGE